MDKNQIEQKLSDMKKYYGSYSSSYLWMGIELSWERRAKKNGGNYKRNGVWGIWRYLDVVKNRDLSYEEAVIEISRPFNERIEEADAARIKFCAMCGDIAIGEKEQQTWGTLSYVYAIRTYGSVNFEFPLSKHVAICFKCCQKIINGKFKDSL